MNMIKKSLTISLIFLLFACATSESINQQAESSYAKIVAAEQAKGAVDTSSQTAQRIHKVFRKMVPYADQENKTGLKFNWRLTVVKKNELNAWAMAGGKMMFYTGIVDQLQLNDDEIATVMGHEMAHALQEHSKSAQNLGTATSILGSVVDVAASVALGVDTGGLAGSVMMVGIDMPYSRSNETEADEVGLMLMAKSGYNPQAAPRLWEKMQAKSGGGGGLLSTHPSDKARQENLRRLLPQAMEIYSKRNAM